METTNKLGKKEKVSYGLGAVGKDMVYMLSASYILYYYQDLLGVSAIAMGIILLAARVFDAFNDPIMGVLVSKTKTKFGKFRPWLLIGTLTNAVILFLMFACPPALNGAGLVAYAAVTYVLWGVTYTMMDIPFWSMVPAFTEPGKEREGLAALGRSCAGVGSALISIVTVKAVAFLGGKFGGQTKNQIEVIGYKYFTLIVAVLFILFTVIMCINIKEKSTVDVKTVSVGEMFKALIKNDQAVVMVVSIVLVNTALYVTSNLVIYFFKYDFSPASWESNYTLFNTFGGGFQILSMMLLFPLLRKFMDSMKIFYTCFFMAIVGYIILLGCMYTGTSNFYALVPSAFLIMSAMGMLNVVITIFLANTVDYGELKNGHRDEAVIFSMQTFVVKLASGIAAFVASVVLACCNIKEESSLNALDSAVDAAQVAISGGNKMAFRLCLTLIPIVLLIIGLVIFRSKYFLSDERLEEINAELHTRRLSEETGSL